jgi:alkylhydroperoxidase family enzyme
MARIPLPTRETYPDTDRWDRQAARGPILNIQRVFMANPDLRLDALGAWKGSGLSPRAREIVILRAAFVQESGYEWHQHVRIARNEGLTDAEIDAVRTWDSSTLFSEDERALLAYVDEMAQKRRPGDEAFKAMSKARTPAEILGITYLISLYFALARVMSALDLETETAFVGWEIGKK